MYSFQVEGLLRTTTKFFLSLNMGFGLSKDKKDEKGKKALGKGLMGAAKLAAKAGTSEIGDLVDTENLGEGGELLEGAAKFAAKTAVKTAVKAAEKQLQDKDEKKSDHDKEGKDNKDNIKAATKVATKITSMAIDAATD
ncbi:hypothetical protein CHS0354_013552 [Potamilus streckersoni]|uniref:Uncharacterized protein n=1 Tax=Potamilus streckersoni TaxID=2493646 RepID=A0AAE0VY91_9BIVA|nr:hypothetical protein CHS0354_013552 [Potamilus streckersoni]